MNTLGKRSWAGLIVAAVSLPATAQVEVTILTAPDGAARDHFGQVSLSGDIAVVGARGDDDACPPPACCPDDPFCDPFCVCNSGSAYVFARNQGGPDNWGSVKKLTAFDAAQGKVFGRSVAISGELVVVGSKGNGGSAYLFGRNEGGPDNWGLVIKLTAFDGAEGDGFSYSLAISGDTIAVGARRDDDACPGDPDCNSGSVYVFDRNEGGPNNWGLVVKLTASDAVAEDDFGHSVAVEGEIIVVGTQTSCPNPPPPPPSCGPGSAYVFYRNQGGADNWGQVKKLTASDGAAGDHLGVSVAIDGDTIAVGANLSGSGAAAAYVFNRNQGGPDNWGQVKKLTRVDAGGTFGNSLAATGDIVIVGASGTQSAYVFARDQGGPDNWGYVVKFLGPGVGDYGWSVAASGEVAIVGDDLYNLSTGAAWVYQLTSPCPWDCGDGDGVVGIVDFLALLGQWGQVGSPCDVDGGGVGITDFLDLLAHWGFEGPCFFVDCNDNGVNDLDDIVDGSSTDFDANLVPDECQLVPPGDDCGNAVPIGDGMFPFNTTGANTDGPLDTCAVGPVVGFVQDIWFLYSPPCIGTATFSLCNDADYDTRLGIYTTDLCPPGSPLACNDDARGCGQTSEIQVFVHPVVQYLVRIGGTSTGGHGTLEVSCQP